MSKIIIKSKPYPENVEISTIWIDCRISYQLKNRGIYKIKDTKRKRIIRRDIIKNRKRNHDRESDK